MSPFLLIVILVVLLLAVLAGSRIRSRAAAARAEIAGELRLQMLQRKPADLDLEVAPGQPFSIVMDVAYPQAVASVVAALSGDASIYLSTGGGFLGGIEHESVREAAKTFVRQAAAHLDQLTKTTSYPYPTPGKVSFYAGTPEGTWFAEAGETELQAGTHPLSPLYAAGHEVIAALRVTTEA